jgi:hypothetical protein
MSPQSMMMVVVVITYSVDELDYVLQDGEGDVVQLDLGHALSAFLHPAVVAAMQGISRHRTFKGEGPSPIGRIRTW